ncbi:MAG: hypothetical protein HFI33_11815 [Lachnospiraceae bacterium]|nr:hypothetical protein [Lachnospiraceae bacterium]
MQHKESRNLLTGIVFSLLFGTLAHFIYGWSGNHPVAGLFFPVNESVWEHMKLIFFPILFYTIYEVTVYLKLNPHFLSARLLGILAGTFLMPCLFFTYTGFLGRSLLPLDLCIFVLCVLTAFFLSRYLEVSATELSLPFFVLFIILLFFLLLFFSFTYVPPNLPLFWQPERLRQITAAYTF